MEYLQQFFVSDIPLIAITNALNGSCANSFHVYLLFLSSSSIILNNELINFCFGGVSFRNSLPYSSASRGRSGGVREVVVCMCVRARKKWGSLTHTSTLRLCYNYFIAFTKLVSSYPPPSPEAKRGNKAGNILRLFCSRQAYALLTTGYCRFGRMCTHNDCGCWKGVVDEEEEKLNI